MESMEHIIQILTSFVFYIFSCLVWNRIYNPRKNYIYKAVISIILASCGMVLVNVIQIPILNFAYSLLSIVALNVLLYEVKGRSYVVHDIVILLVMLVADMLSVSIMAVLLHRELGEILDNNWYTTAATVLNWIFLFLGFRLFLFLIPDKEITKIKRQEFLFFIILVGGELFILQFLNDTLLEKMADYKLVIVLLIFLSLDIYVAYLLYQISESYKTEKKLELLSLQSSMQLRAYQELSEKYIASRHVVHDVKKHMQTIEGLIQNDNIQLAQKYKEKLVDELDKLVPAILVDNVILSVIINEKLSLARSNNIQLNVEAEYSDFDFLDDFDITVLFCNLIDNALEACMELPENKRHVKLFITRHKSFVYICTENYYDKVIRSGHNKYLSTKNSHQGLGIDNISSIILKYNGNMSIDVDNELFKIEIIIPISEPG